MRSVQLGLLLVRTQIRHDRWRLISVAFATCVVTIVIGVLIAGQNVRSVAQQRANDRVPVAATSEQPTDTWFLGRSEVIDTVLIEIIAFDPVNPSSDSVLPRGVTALPEPGGAVVSPALAQLMDRNDLIASRFPDAAADPIATTGLRDAGELIAYVRTPAAGSLENNSSSIRASSIGGDPNSVGSSLFVGPITDGIAASLFAALLFLTPSVLILRAGVAARSEVLDRRVASMIRLGAPRSIVARLIAVDAAVPAFAGACAGTAIVRFVASFDLVVPFTRFDVRSSDLDPGVTTHLTLIGAVTAVAAITTVLASTHKPVHLRDVASERVPSSTSPSQLRRALRFVSTSVGPFLIAAGAIIRGETGGNLFLVGLLLFLLGLPKILTALVTRIGHMLAKKTSVELHLAGARINDSKQRTARLLISLICLLVVVSIVQVFYTRFDPATPSAQATTTTFTVYSTDSYDPSQAEFLLNLKGVQAVVVQGPESIIEDASTGAIIDNTAFTMICRSPSTGCPPIGTLQPVASIFPATANSAVATSITPNSVTTISDLGADDLSEVVRATVVLDTLAVPAAWSQISRRLSAPYLITDDVFQVVPSPIIGWVNLGLYTFVALTLIAIGLAYAAHSRTSSDRNSGLVRLGMGRTSLRKVITAEVAIPFTIATAIAASISFTMAYMYAYLDGLNPPSLTFMTALTASAIAIGALVTTASAAGGARTAERAASRKH